MTTKLSINCIVVSNDANDERLLAVVNQFVASPVILIIILTITDCAADCCAFIDCCMLMPSVSLL